MPRSSRHIGWVAVAALALPLAALAQDPPYKDAAEVRDEVTRIVNCEASRSDFMRFGMAMTPLIMPGGDTPLDPALSAWRKEDDDKNMFAMIFQMPEPITVFGHTTSELMMAGQGVLAVIDGDVAEALSKQLKLEPGDNPLTRHIRSRVVRQEGQEEGGFTYTIAQTLTTLPAYPGKTMVGCEYRFGTP